jgi:hypothetical protein
MLNRIVTRERVSGDGYDGFDVVTANATTNCGRSNDNAG